MQRQYKLYFLGIRVNLAISMQLKLEGCKIQVGPVQDHSCRVRL